MMTEAEIKESVREPMTVHLLSAHDIVETIASGRAEVRRLREELAKEQHRTSEHIRDKHRILNEYESERAKLRAEINDLLPELDATQAQLTQACRELSTVTGQLDAARKALTVLWAYVNKHCGDWYLRADRRAIADMVEGANGALKDAR